MPGRLTGKVALVSGAARGLGRSHAAALAAEGADIIAFDICRPVPAQGAPPASSADLAETIELVERLDRRIVSEELDVRDHETVDRFVAAAAAELGRLDIVVANAAVNGPGTPVADTTPADWRSVIDTNLTGIFTTVKAALPAVLEGGRGGSIILMSSSLALRPVLNFGAYTASKHGVVGLMETLAVELGGKSIRVNSIHPTGVATDLFLNPATYRLFRPDLDEPTLDDVKPTLHGLNVLPTPWIEPVDVSNLVVFLASEEGRYITGASIPVDAGYQIR